MNWLDLIPKLPADGTVADILVYVIALNLFLSGLSKALDKIKDKTATRVDNKIYDVLTKVLSVLQKAIDLVSANVAHKK